MKWIYSIKNRMTIAILLMVLFVSVFVKNMLDEENVSDLTTSCSTIYQDRLLPESYIYHLSDFLYKKERLLDDCVSKVDYLDLSEKNIGYNTSMDSIMVAFEETYLTPDEDVVLSDLKENIHGIYVVEGVLTGGGDLASFDQAKEDAEVLIAKAAKNLEDLSDIQLTVGKQVNDDSKRIMAGSSILTRFETAILVILGVVINALIFGVISSRSKMKQRPHLN
ncbi:hypothetical protein DN752_21320 [Echinicola strongylocentroti]|uniref:Chemotaxis methyl-accepting receptor HlyB-like 4HB MCP domain-containing protein n=1 Tax=Echinicola strongylocentroti TaxID=1795355 RepID=A0A2Z4IN01_9BACT|nr:MCP four helix bundle domain-containing protein [Echinicola strongylocentroti]AWW32482.1 hypothetical protein DN752_21320 [Echinicola strongylocentroti]